VAVETGIAPSELLADAELCELVVETVMDIWQAREREAALASLRARMH
jgi:hypothetical protein